MKELLLNRENELNILADEIVDLVTNSKKLTDVLKIAQGNEVIQKRNVGEIATIKTRIGDLENRIDKLVKNFRTNIIEAERLITEKYEEINKVNEQKIMNLQSQIEDLRDLIIKVRNEAKVKEYIKAQMR